MKLIAEDLTVTYGEVIALNSITATIEGERIALLGRNGAGKTTFIKTLLGLVTPQKGDCCLVLGNSEFYPTKDYLKIRMKVGYMPEEDILIEEMTPFEFILYSAMLACIPEKFAKSRTHFLLELCGLREERYRPIKSLPKGIRQKVKLVQALISGESFFFLDEPASALDPESREELLELIKKIPEYFEGGGFLLSTHIIGDVEKVCDYVVVMDNGEIKFFGSISSLRTPCSNIIEIILSEGEEDFILKIKEIGGEVKREREKVLVGLKYGTHYITKNGRKITYKEGEEVSFLFVVAYDTGSTIRHIEPLKESIETLFLQIREDGKLHS